MKSYVAALLLIVTSSNAPAQTPRIDPAGISGALFFCAGEISEATAERFIDLAGGETAKVVFLTHRIADEKKNKDWPEIEIVNAAAKKKGARDPGQAALKDAKTALRDATGVWLLVESPKSWREELQKHPHAEEFRGLLKRGGVIACVGDDLMTAGDGFHLLPGFVRFKQLPVPAGMIGFHIDKGAAMLIKGRTISAVGTGKVTLSIPGKPAPREITVQGKIQEDLTALRRSAFDRANAFPSPKVESPVVEKGTLVIVGGGGSPDGMYKKFVEYAGGPDKAKIVIFPTANADPLPKRDSVAEVFRKAGALKATVLYGRTWAEVESKQFLDTLQEATGLWFDGGRQWRFVDCYENTKALPLMFDVLKRDGVIGGTSAGATIQGDYLARGGVFNNFDIRYEGYERGLGFLKGVAIDQHFTQRKRQADMTQLMKIHPQYLGIGLDEATAIVVKGSIADVIGRGKVFFYDTNRKTDKGQPDYESLSAGGRYDLKARKVLAREK